MTRAERTQLLFWIQEGIRHSDGMNGMAEQWARVERRLPVPEDHARIMSMLLELRSRGLIYAQEAKARKVTVLTCIELTEEGKRYLDRGLHPLWIVGWTWKEFKEIAATVAAKLLQP
jgi:hypothetical protein